MYNEEMNADLFKTLEYAKKDPIFHLDALYKKDIRKHKVNLIIGAFCDDACDTYTFKSVRSVEKELVKLHEPHDYLPIEGDLEFLKAIHPLYFDKSYLGVQTAGCSHALLLVAKFLKSQNINSVYIPNPTWANHRGIFECEGLKIGTYAYYDHGFHFENIKNAFLEMPKNSCVVIQGNGHNPTGCDFTKEQLDDLIDMILEQEHLPILDVAYLGLAKGLKEDKAFITAFEKKGCSFFTCISFAKNFGLYSQRVGACFACFEDQKLQEKIKSHLEFFTRKTISNPPSHGSFLIKTILQNKELKLQWEGEMKFMLDRLQLLRSLFYEKLCEIKKLHCDLLKTQTGLFSFLPAIGKLSEELASEHGIYLLPNGRINLSGMNEHTMPLVVEQIKKHFQ